jgi:uncharacterized RDD family membrane protein YckC
MSEQDPQVPPQQPPQQQPPQETPAATPPPPPAQPAYAPQGPSGPRANFGQRFLAYLIDVAIYFVLYLILWAIVGQTLASLLAAIVFLGYFAYFEGGPRGQTPGKRVLGIRVVDFNTGGPIGYGRGVVRYLGRIVSGIVCLLGYFWMLWDREKQTWHDKIATTVVVPVAQYPITE